MGRFFNREAAGVALCLLVISGLVAVFVEVPIWAKVVIPIATLAILHWPVTIFAQEHILNFYTERGHHDRALALALDIRDSSLDRRSRQRASLNVAFVHMARGDYENALKNLRTIVTTSEYPALKSVVDGTTGYCLAHLGRDLPEAERSIQASLKLQPDGAVFVTFLALVRLKQGHFKEAEELLEKSFALDPNPKLPHPGERAFMKALILEGLGETEKSLDQLKRAQKAGYLFGRKAFEKLNAALAGPPASTATPELPVARTASQTALPAHTDTEATSLERSDQASS